MPDGVRRTSNCCGDTAPVDAMQSGVMCSSPPARRCWPARVRQSSTRVLFCTSAHRVPCAVLARCALCSSCTTKVRASNRLLMCPGAALGPHFPLAKLMPSAASLPRDEALGFLGWGRVTALPPSHVAAQGGQRAARSTDGIRLHRAETELSHLPYPPIHPFHSTRHSACPRLFVFFVRARFAASTENTLTSPPSPFFFFLPPSALPAARPGWSLGRLDVPDDGAEALEKGGALGATDWAAGVSEALISPALTGDRGPGRGGQDFAARYGKAWVGGG